MTGDEIRQRFLRFFDQQDHLVLPSAKLLPDDPTTYFTSAGMQPFVPYFLGNERPPRRRIATCQKCLRADDLDEVGYTARHLSFFEMLGNFSFGDYFKEEAIAWGWQFVREGLELSPERLWVSVYENDDEAARIWEQKVGVAADRIVRFGMADNWWGPVGNSGPCGPCSEIFLDRGPEWGDAASPVEDDGDRYVELWNLVFQQYNSKVSKKELMQTGEVPPPLPAPGIDTGAGLERIAAAMQGVSTVFETDLLQPLCQAVISLANGRGGHYRYDGDAEVRAAVNRIADHVRALTFAICDGMFPSNKAGGYVLRQILRRAARFGRLRLGLVEPFVHELTEAVADRYAAVYPDVREGLAAAQAIILQEEQRFSDALNHGIPRLDEALEALDEGAPLDGDTAFYLYETYGVPIEVQTEIAAEGGHEVDVEAFETIRSNRGSKAIAIGVEGHGDFGDDLLADIEETEFTGYDNDVEAVRVVAIVRGAVIDSTRGLVTGGERMETAVEGDDVLVVLDSTPFYAESGGQIGDTGELASEGVTLTVGSHVADRAASEVVVSVTDTQKDKNGRWLHQATVVQGVLEVGESLEARVDSERRDSIRRAHTATHLLHAALREVLGPHVAQAGSLVEPDRLRFDFSHFRQVSPEEQRQIEGIANRTVLSNYPMRIEERALEEARELGALMFFGEKYGARVRVVNVGEEFGGPSTELCGGTHVARTGDIGQIRIINETSVGSGVRRIEAYTGEGALVYAWEHQDQLENGKAALRTQELLPGIERLQQRVRELQDEVKEARSSGRVDHASRLAGAGEQINGLTLVAEAMDLPADDLKTLADDLVVRIEPGVVFLGTADDGKVILVCKASDAAVQAGAHAGNAVKAAAQVAGGGGGGRPNFAQAGGKDPAKLAEAVAAGVAALKEQLGG